MQVVRTTTNKELENCIMDKTFVWTVKTESQRTYGKFLYAAVWLRKYNSKLCPFYGATKSFRFIHFFSYKYVAFSVSSKIVKTYSLYTSPMK